MKENQAGFTRKEAVVALRTAMDIKAETNIKIWQAYIACLDRDELNRKGN